MRNGIKRVGVLLLVTAILMACSNPFKSNQDIETVDGMIYTFIVGKVEGNDDLLASVLADQAQGILVDGRHAYPGDAEIMGGQYEIVRYSNEYENGTLYYQVRFFRPSTGKISTYNVIVVNTDKGWRIAENGSADELLMAIGMKEEEGEVVHEWED